MAIRSLLSPDNARCAILIFLAALFVSGPAAASKRIALVVGNSAYQHVVALTNPANDARLMAKTLRGLRFTLVGDQAQLNLDKAHFDRAVQMFRDEAQGADVALFYYAGHGMQMRGANYLVPVDADLKTQADVDFQMLDTDLVLRQMETARAKLNLLILDACRNNPFRGRGFRAIGGGLAQMQAPEGTLISFATQPGNVALDGRHGHSPFTRALANVMQRPGLDIFRTFNEVGVIVSHRTNKEQQPWLSSSPINGDFFFAGRPALPAPDPKIAQQAEQKRRFDVAQRIGTEEAWTLFLKDNKRGFYADLAKAERDKIVAAARAQAAEQKRARSEAEARAKAAALERARQDAAAKSARETLEKVQRETAAAKKAQEAARAAQAAAEKAARDLQKAIAKAAQEAAAKTAKERQQRIRNQVASLPPPSKETAPPGAPVLNPGDIARLLKAHLSDVGCDPGDENAAWDRKSQQALEKFNKYAGTHLDAKAPSLAALQTVDAKHGRVCPLVCGRGTRRKGDQCVAITCKRGYALGADGVCHRVQGRPKTVISPTSSDKRQSSAGGGSGKRHGSGSGKKHYLRTLCLAGDTAACRLRLLSAGSGSGQKHHLRTLCIGGDLSACRLACSLGHGKACRRADMLAGGRH